jgi:hypothetical protein
MILRFFPQPDSPHSQIFRKAGQKKAEPNSPNVLRPSTRRDSTPTSRHLTLEGEEDADLRQLELHRVVVDSLDSLDDDLAPPPPPPVFSSRTHDAEVNGSSSVPPPIP